MDTPQAINLPVSVLCAGALATSVWACIRCPAGLSLFGFESWYWDLGLQPALGCLALAAFHLPMAAGPRRRFLVGFLACGLIAALAYAVSCSRGARWSLVSVLQPFQTGYKLATGAASSVRELSLSGVATDTAILVLIPCSPRCWPG